jgi:hypothetical protein
MSDVERDMGFLVGLDNPDFVDWIYAANAEMR